MKQNIKNFLIGLSIVILLYFIFFLVYYFNNETISFIEFVVFPLFCYFGTFLAFKINKALVSNKYLIFSKWLCLIVFGLFSFLNLFNGLTINDLDPFVVCISVLFNWNIKEEKIDENGKYDTSLHHIIYYLIPFVVLLVVYVIVAMLFYRYTNIEENKLKLIFLYGGILVLEYWGVYLFYRYFLRKNKAAKILKIIFLFAFSFGIYTFAKSITQYSTTSLLLVDLSAVVSVTVIDLLFSNHKITEKKETEECKDD